METIEKTPIVYTMLRLKGYKSLNDLRRKWYENKYPRIPFVDWKRMFDNDVFGDASLRVHRGYKKKSDGTLTPVYERFVKIDECIKILQSLII